MQKIGSLSITIKHYLLSCTNKTKKVCSIFRLNLDNDMFKDECPIAI